MKHLLLFLLCVPFLASAQDLTGVWKGKLTQDTGGYAPEYSLELNITQKKKNIYGESYAYLGKVVVAKLRFTGYFDKDSIYLKEYREGVIEKVLPPDYILCIKNFILSYDKSATGAETLTGRWDGVGYTQDSESNFPGGFNTRIDQLPCVPGLIYLSKNDALQIETSVPSQLVDFSDTLYNTKVNKIQEIEVENQVIQISLNDYEKVDGDIVSVYLNRKKVADHISIRRAPITFTIALNANYINNEILIYAENLGRIPPNTSLMVVRDGDKSHDVYISSDLKNTAAVYLKYVKK